MAIAFDSVSTGGSTVGTSRTVSHTCAGTDRILFVGVNASTGDLITGATYNGVSMTLVQKLKTGGAASWNYLYVLPNPSTGVNNVVISASSSTTIYSTATSYTGANQSTSMNALNTSTITSSTLSMSTSLTTTVNNCWTLCFTVNDTAVFNANSDLIRGTNNGANIFDSNGPITPAGSKTMTQGCSGSGNAGVIMVAFSEPITSTNSNFFMFF